MKRGIKLFFVFLIALVALFSLSAAIFTPAIPSSCSNDAISSTWSLIFNEVSSGITIFNTTQTNRCNGYLAFKVQGDKVNILTSIDSSSGLTNYTYVNAYEGNLIQNCIDTIRSFTSFQNYTLVSSSLSLSSLQSCVKTRINNITSASDANSNFTSSFKATPGTFESASSSGISYFLYSQSESTSTEGKLLNGTVIGNYSLSYISYLLNTTFVCTSNWTALNTSCIADDSQIIWYNDTNSCAGATRPANITRACDYDGNGIIGNISSSILSNLALSFYVDSSLGNLSRIYNTTKSIELKEENITRVSFNYPFSSPLNFKAINITKQPSSASYGYLAVNGLSGTVKTFTLDKIMANSNRVCIINAEASISEISGGCNSTREFFVNCPGTSGSYTCNITNDKFIVSGLTNSVVYEFSGTSSSCSENWTCQNWTACTSGTRTRICTDTRNCGTTANRPALSETCTIAPIACITNWTCSPWSDKCPNNGIKTRTCTDKNKCQSPLDKPRPELSQSCTNETNWTIIIIITLIVLVLIIGIIYYIIKIKSRKGDEGYVNIQNMPRSPPATPQFTQQRPFQPQLPIKQPSQPSQQSQPAQPSSPGVFNPRPSGTNPTPQQPQRTFQPQPPTEQPNSQNQNPEDNQDANQNSEKKVDFEF